MDEKHCNRCGEDKAETEWNPSQWRKKGGWCKACYREWHRLRYTPKGEADDTPRDCEVCGVSYQPKSRILSTYCSRACKEEARKRRLAAERLGTKPADRICMHCGEPLTQSMRADAIFCSKECNYRAHALQRKLRARTGEEGKPGYLRAFICNRDGWRCGICRKSVSRTKQHPDPLCASLDHVIPVSEGGTNDVWNLRLTHLRCNLSRRNAGGGEQLALL